MATTGHPLRRSDHRIRADDRRAVSHNPPREAVALLLADSVPECAVTVAKLSIAACLGFLRHQHVLARLNHLLVPSADPGSGSPARQVEGQAKERRLRIVESGMAGHGASMGSAGACGESNGCDHYSGGGISPYGRVVGFFA